MPDVKWEYKTIRTPKYIINKYKIKYGNPPTHDLAYRVRTHPVTKVSQYQPYCVCRQYRNDRWYPHRGQRIERLFEYEHTSEIDKQRTLFGPERDSGKDTEAYLAYGPGHNPSDDRYHDRTL